MNKKCNICGHIGENVWRDGKYYCAACGGEIDVTQHETSSINGSNNAVPINVTCPICRNNNNNYLQNGQCHCSMCGSTFNLQQSNANMNNNGYAPNNAIFSERRAELEKQKNNRLLWGIIWFFLFWPVAVYHFYKLYQIHQELSKLQ